MKQIFTKHFYTAFYGQSTSWVPLIAGQGACGLVANGINESRHAWSCHGVLRNLAVTFASATGYSSVITVMVNGVASALTVTLGAAETDGVDVTHAVTVAPGDDLALQLDGTTMVYPGLNGGYSIEFDAITANESGYGIPPFGGSINLGSPTTVGRLGGALGNGNFELSPATVSSESNTYSIVSTPGTVTRLDAKALSGAPGTGVWTIQLVLNTVIQDGTGGTVNTVCVITGTDTSAFATFSLPLVPTDHLDILVVRSGTNAPFSIAHVGCSVAFTADEPDRFMLTGGNNNACDTTGIDYQWLQNEQQTAVEANAWAPVGPTGFTIEGLYVERTVAPDPGNSWTHTLRVSGVDSALVVVVADTETSGLLLEDVVVVDGEYLNLSVVPFSGPRASQLHWGLAVSSAPPTPPPPPTGTTMPTRRLRQWGLPTSPEGHWVFVRRLELLIQAGVGLTSGQGSDPHLLVQISRDGGQTWGPERWLAAGRLGDYDARQVLGPVGRYRDGAVRVVMSDPVAWLLLGAWGTLETGTS